MKKLALFLAFLFAVMPLLSSCAEHTPIPCREILDALLKNESALPAGRIYSIKAAKGDTEYLPERLINALYSGGEEPPMRSGWLDIAMFLPTSSHPCELAVILCDSPDTATDTARLLCSRLDSVKAFKADDEYSHILGSASVSIVKNYVLLIISSDAQEALKTAKKIIS